MAPTRVQWPTGGRRRCSAGDTYAWIALVPVLVGLVGCRSGQTSATNADASTARSSVSVSSSAVTASIARSNIAQQTAARTTAAAPSTTQTGGEVVTPAGVVLPNPARTPGATNPDVTQANIASTICVAGWSSTVRPPSSYTTGLKQQQLTSGYAYQGDENKADYEEDHLISLELGGSPTSPLNLWPEPYAGADGARVKDQVENRLHTLVCDGQLSLTTAQHAIAANWFTAYLTYVGTPAPPVSAPSVTAAPPTSNAARSVAPPPPAALTCSATMSNPNPAQYSTTDVIVHTASGAAVTATAHYKSTDTTHTGTAANGVADLPFRISRATIGYSVEVDVTVAAQGSTASCSTSFTPS